MSMSTVTFISVTGRAAFHLTPILGPYSQHTPMPLVFLKMLFGFCSPHLLLRQEDVAKTSIFREVSIGH